MPDAVRRRMIPGTLGRTIVSRRRDVRRSRRVRPGICRVLSLLGQGVDLQHRWDAAFCIARSPARSQRTLLFPGRIFLDATLFGQGAGPRVNVARGLGQTRRWRCCIGPIEATLLPVPECNGTGGPQQSEAEPETQRWRLFETSDGSFNLEAVLQ